MPMFSTSKLVKSLALFCGSSFLFCLLFLPFISQAAFNRQINYQGKLTDSTGVAVADGSYSIVFTLYDALSGGNVVWTETDTVTTSGGLFSLMLGAVSTLENVDFNRTLYLGINVNGDGEMSPRKVLGSVPAAFESGRLDGNASSTAIDINGYLNVTGNATATGVFYGGAGSYFGDTSGNYWQLGVTNFSSLGNLPMLKSSGLNGTSNAGGIFDGLYVISSEGTGADPSIAFFGNDIISSQAAIAFSTSTNQLKFNYADSYAFDDAILANTDLTVSGGITLGGVYRTTWPTAGGISDWYISGGDLTPTTTIDVSLPADLTVSGGITLGGVYRTTWPTAGGISDWYISGGDLTPTTTIDVSLPANLVVNATSTLATATANKIVVGGEIPLSGVASLDGLFRQYKSTINGGLGYYQDIYTGNYVDTGALGGGAVYYSAGNTNLTVVHDNGPGSLFNIVNGSDFNLSVAENADLSATMLQVLSAKASSTDNSHIYSIAGVTSQLDIGSGTTIDSDLIAFSVINNISGGTIGGKIVGLNIENMSNGITATGGNYNIFSAGIGSLNMLEGSLTVGGTTTLATTSISFTPLSGLTFSNEYYGPYDWPYIKFDSGNGVIPGSMLNSHTALMEDSIMLLGRDNMPRLSFAEMGVSAASLQYATNTEVLTVSSDGGIVFSNDITASSGITLGGVRRTSWPTGSSGGTDVNWSWNPLTDMLTPATSTSGLVINGSSTFNGGLIASNATSTGDLYVGGGITLGGVYRTTWPVGRESDWEVTGGNLVPTSTINVVLPAKLTAPYASTTALTVSGNSYLGTVSSGVWNGSAVGVTYGGTGLSSSPSYGQLLLGNASNGYTLTATSSLGMLTTNVAEGTNLYWTTTRFDNRLSATSTLPNIWSLPGLGIVGSSSATTTFSGYLAVSSRSNVGTVIGGTWQGSTINVAYGGTGLTALKAGYLPFGAGTNAFATSTNLYWDSTNSRLSLGALTSPNAALQVQATTEQLRSAYDANNYLSLTVGSTGNATFSLATNAPVLTPNFIFTNTGANTKVGINKTAPSTALDVVGTASSTGLQVNGGAIITGNVGIGDASPLSLLTVGNGDKFQIGSDGQATTTGRITAMNGFSVANTGYVSVNSAPIYGLGYSNYVIGGADYAATQLSGYYGISFVTGLATSVAIPSMSLTQTGNLGIGTIIPDYKLVVEDSGSSKDLFRVGNSTNSNIFSIEKSGIVYINKVDSGLSFNGNSFVFSAPPNYDKGSFGLFYQPSPTTGGASTGGVTIVESATSSWQIVKRTSMGATNDRRYTLNSNSLQFGFTQDLGATDFQLALKLSTTSKTVIGTSDRDFSELLSIQGTSTTDYDLLGLYASTGDKKFFVSSSGNVQIPKGSLCIDNDGSCNGTVPGRIYYVTSATGNSDLAENYQPFEADLAAGDIVTFSSLNSTAVSSKDTFGIRRAGNQNNAVGVISTSPGIMLGYDESVPNQLPVALSGRVPVKVSLEGGDINVGDQITLSSLPGVGTRATTSGQMIGFALESFNASSPRGANGLGKIMVFVNLGYSRLSSTIANGQINTNGLWGLDEETGQIKALSAVNLNGQNLSNVRAIASASGAWSISEDGSLRVKSLSADQLIVEQGVTIKDRATGQNTCVFVENGVIKTSIGECSGNGSQSFSQTTTNATTTVVITPLDNSSSSPSGEATSSETTVLPVPPSDQPASTSAENLPTETL